VSEYSFQFSKVNTNIAISADVKSCPEDFQVREELGFTPDGAGEHVLFHIRKINITTEAVLTDLSKQLGVATRDIGCCGLKDKLGVTQQWFSVVIPIKQEIPTLEGNSWQVLEAVRHGKKLRKGIHKGNHFVITLRNLDGDIQQLQGHINNVAANGFPNYFGEQRFGRSGENIQKAERLFAGHFKCKPFQRSMYYSAARSYLFNCYLSARVNDGHWNTAIAGDSYNLSGSNAIFGPDVLNDELIARVSTHDIHPVGPLFGDGAIRLEDAALEYARPLLESHSQLIDGLVSARVKSAWRPLRVVPKSLNFELVDGKCVLAFSLPVGSYATVMIRELVNVNEAVW